MIIFWKYVFLLNFIIIIDYEKFSFELTIHGKSKTRKMVQTFTKTVSFFLKL